MAIVRAHSEAKVILKKSISVRAAKSSVVIAFMNLIRFTIISSFLKKDEVFINVLNFLTMSRIERLKIKNE
mgnify:CR=1 FL=1